MMSERRTEQVKGPASYFPSIEKKYGRPIAEWQQVVRSAPGYGAGAKHMELVALLKDSTASATATPTRSSPTRWRRTGRMRLRLELEATGGTTAGFRIPDEVVDELGGGPSAQGRRDRRRLHLAVLDRADGRRLLARDEQGQPRRRRRRGRPDPRPRGRRRRRTADGRAARGAGARRRRLGSRCPTPTSGGSPRASSARRSPRPGRLGSRRRSPSSAVSRRTLAA